MKRKSLILAMTATALFISASIYASKCIPFTSHSWIIQWQQEIDGSIWMHLIPDPDEKISTPQQSKKIDYFFYPSLSSTGRLEIKLIPCDPIPPAPATKTP